jgi:chitin disaccharide deacetylase
VKRLIVNGDDFGMSEGVNRGIVEAHERGILTSASLIVDGNASAHAAEFAKALPTLDVGLHVDISSAIPPPDLPDELAQQFERFVSLTGRPPTHVDSHHHAHEAPEALPAFVSFAERHGLPLRGHSDVRTIHQFYGQWDGRPHHEQIGPDGFGRIVETEVAEGFNELYCHPGYAEGLESSYAVEREIELRTLCDLAVRAHLSKWNIELAGFRQVGRR